MLPSGLNDFPKRQIILILITLYSTIPLLHHSVLSCGFDNRLQRLLGFGY